MPLCLVIVFWYRSWTTGLDKEDLGRSCLPFVMAILIFRERKESLATKIHIQWSQKYAIIGQRREMTKRKELCVDS